MPINKNDELAFDLIQKVIIPTNEETKLILLQDQLNLEL